MRDPDRLNEALAEHREIFGQRSWGTATVYWARSRLAFVHAKNRSATGFYEAMVVARIQESGFIRIRRYLLLPGEGEWRYCNREAFEGFLDEGISGLKRGSTRVKPTICDCPFKVHRSSERARLFARKTAERYGTSEYQRAYRCGTNPRAFHLTAQSRKPRTETPGAQTGPERHETK